MHKIVRKDIWEKKDEIIHSYLNEKQSLSAIARAYEVSNRLIKDVLLTNGVNLRLFPEACSLWSIGGKAIRRKDLWDHREEIKRLYVEGKISTIKIARRYGCGWSTISRLLKRCSVKLRTVTEANRLNGDGRTKDSHGYILIKMPNHPNCDKHGYVREHRLVVENRIGRYLRKDEKVHHNNGIRHDNRDDNLKLVSNSEHQIYNEICSKCELRKEIRLLKWQIKELQNRLQVKLL